MTRICNEWLSCCVDAAPLEVEIRPGRVRHGLVLIMTLLAAAAIGLSGVGIAGAGAAAIAAGAWLWWQWRAPGQGLRLRLGPGKAVRLVLDARTRVSGAVGRSPFVSPWFIGLSVVPPRGRRHHLGLFRDQMEPDAFRRLASRLRSS